jgi:hypothetical protein
LAEICGRGVNTCEQEGDVTAAQGGGLKFVAGCAADTDRHPEALGRRPSLEGRRPMRRHLLGSRRDFGRSSFEARLRRAPQDDGFLAIDLTMPKKTRPPTEAASLSLINFEQTN